MKHPLFNLPPAVIQQLRDQYRNGVRYAQRGFSSAAADEDSLTGALGQEFARLDDINVVVGDRQYDVHIDWTKLRGRGRGAPEKPYGADGVFQIEVWDALRKSVQRKGLPFQAKTNWDGKLKPLAKQCADIQQSLGSGIVINFTKSGYEACTTSDCVRFDGSYQKLKNEGLIKPLEEFLALDFLNCMVGTVGQYFDTDSETFFGIQGQIFPPPPTVPGNVITTTVDSKSV